MLEYEGSRIEFLKLLAEFGEEPAFIERARAPQAALESLVQACEAKRDEILKWPRIHLSTLSAQIQGDWSRLGSLLAASESVTMLETLNARMQLSSPVKSSWFDTDRAALRRFLESAERFNRSWREYIDGLDLEAVNKPRRDFNQFYLIEKSCAFGGEAVAEGFEPLGMIDRGWLDERFPLLVVPQPAS